MPVEASRSSSTPDFTEAFCRDGFVAVRGAVAPTVVRSCVEAIETGLAAHDVDTRDRATWTKPVLRIPCPDGVSFRAAGTSPSLERTYDTLIGAGRWVRHEGVGGTVPVRFPSRRAPGDAGWHIDGSYDVDGAWWVNVHSRGRGLLALFLFTDIARSDAPTELIVGSHLDVPPILAPFGARGVFFGAVAERLPRSTWKRPRVHATGRAGDVFLCHPFLVHRATWPHRGLGPRMVAQPSIAMLEPFALTTRPDTGPVERAIIHSLGGAPTRLLS